MPDTFICPHCSKNIELTEALTHKIKEELEVSLAESHRKEMAALLKSSEAKIKEKVKQETEITLRDRENENKELREQNKGLGSQLLNLTKSIRELKDKDDKRDLEMQKQIIEETQKARTDAFKQSLEENRLKQLEKDKKISDMEKLVEELKLKAQQGSMQTQGEVLELDIEEALKTAFSDDAFKPVEKGVTGADIEQIVNTPRGNFCGTILWEFKRTRHWSDEWVSKLKTDIRASKSNCGAILTQVMPTASKHSIEFYKGIWVTTYANVLPLAFLLRKNLIDVATQRFLAQNSASKAEQLYGFVTSHEFRQQIEALVEVYSEMNDQVLKERVAFEKSWKQREGQVKRLFLSTANVIGGMQGSGAAIAHIKGLELLELEEGSHEKDQPTTNQPARNPTLLDL